MNPYYATGFMSALMFWVWPAFLFKNLDVHWVTVAFFTALLFFGVGRAASEFHIRFIAPREPPRGPATEIAVMCVAIVALGLLTRAGYYLYANAV
jgi:hypothetical protein